MTSLGRRTAETYEIRGLVAAQTFPALDEVLRYVSAQ